MPNKREIKRLAKARKTAAKLRSAGRESGLFWSNTKIESYEDAHNLLVGFIVRSSGFPPSLFAKYQRAGGKTAFRTISGGVDIVALEIHFTKAIDNILSKISKTLTTFNVPANARKEFENSINKELFEPALQKALVEGYNKHVIPYFTYNWPARLPPQPEPLNRERKTYDSMNDFADPLREDRIGVDSEGTRVTTTKKTGKKDNPDDTGDRGRTATQEEQATGISFVRGEVISRIAGRSHGLQQLNLEIHNYLTEQKTLTNVIKDKGVFVLRGPTLADLTFQFKIPNTTSPFKSAFLILELGTGIYARPFIRSFQSISTTPYKLPPTVTGGRQGFWTNLLSVARLAWIKSGIDVANNLKNAEQRATLRKLRSTVENTEEESAFSDSLENFDFLKKGLARYGRRGYHVFYSATSISGFSRGLLIAQRKAKEYASMVAKDEITRKWKEVKEGLIESKKQTVSQYPKNSKLARGWARLYNELIRIVKEETDKNQIEIKIKLAHAFYEREKNNIGIKVGKTNRKRK